MQKAIVAGFLAVALAVGHQAGVISKFAGRSADDISRSADDISRGTDDFSRGTDDFSRGTDDAGRSNEESVQERLADIALDYGPDVAEECEEAIRRGEDCP